MKKVIGILIAIILALGCLSVFLYARGQYYKGNTNERSEVVAGSDSYKDGVREHGQLSVEGTDLVDADGALVQLRGVSSHGILWYPEFVNYPAMAQMRAYGANVFRIAMYANEPDGGYVTDTVESVKLVRQAVENAKAADMYALIDWHVLDEMNPLYDVETAKTFFETISSCYGDDPYIIYEICNEPNGNTSWEDIAEYAEQVIPVIRANAPHSVIIVGTPDYSYSLDEVTPLEEANVLYAYHFYAGQYGDDFENMITSAKQRGIGIFATELGINTEMSEDAMDQGTRYLDYLNDNGISWCAWSLSNKEEPFSMLRTDCNKLDGWTDEDFTEVGKLIIKKLDGE